MLPIGYYYVKSGFRVYPKHHYFLHMVRHVARAGVPKTFWVYGEESKNSQLKRLFNVCSKGHI